MGKKRQAKRFADKVVDLFTDSITEQVFLFIERNDKLCKEYREVAEVLGAESVNKIIGRTVKQVYGLENNGMRRVKISTLATVYTRHKILKDEEQGVLFKE